MRALGFTLVELVVVVAIITILAAIIIMIVNPLELIKQGRDSTRLSDIDNLSSAIRTDLGYVATSSAEILCFNLLPPCSANSSDPLSDIRKSDGSGWVKVNFVSQILVGLPTLPIDPRNDATYHYTYYSDGLTYELNATLESQKYKIKMALDGGDNPLIYEMGSNMYLLN